MKYKNTILSLLLVCIFSFALFTFLGCQKKEYNLTLYFNEEVIYQEKHKEGTEIELNNLVEGYIIETGYLSPDKTDEIMENKIVINKNINVYVEAERLYKIIFGDYIFSYYRAQQEINLPDITPEKELMVFKGWGINDEIKLSDDKPYIINPVDFTNYELRFEPIFENLVLITFDSNGGNELEPIYAEYGTSITLPTCQKEHYDLVGWTYNNKLYIENFIVNSREPINLLAEWKVHNYSINLRFSDHIEIILAQYGQKIGELPDYPVQEPYMFDGWYLDMEFTRKLTANTIYNFNHDIDLFPKVTNQTDIKAFGSGTSSDPYRIYTPEQFKCFENYNIARTSDNVDTRFNDNEYYKIMNDIEVPQNYSINLYQKGARPLINIEGQNYTIKYKNTIFNEFAGVITNLNFENIGGTFYINEPQRCSVINVLYNGTLEYIDFTASGNITIDDNRSLGLLTYENRGAIRNCNCFGNIRVLSAYDGDKSLSLFSMSNYGKIDNCISYANLEGEKFNLNVFSRTNYGSISNCISYGNIKAKSISIISNVWLSLTSIVTIENCEVYGELNASSNIAPILFGSYHSDYSKNVIIRNCKFGCENVNVIQLVIKNNTTTTPTYDLNTAKPYFTHSQCDLDSITKVANKPNPAL